ncbi:hypothetical protein [Roseibium aggregatum]|uniref:Uncharacterized protein n=1 Tax=Roseibium aggregatum TaxID=187304 RepID=A0A939J0I5_9HYPH|nr:hypothetical protein [Roseibium aggregatum]MBN9671126.1 hypothetical protein [Roseibium aggregatum]
MSSSDFVFQKGRPFLSASKIKKFARPVDCIGPLRLSRGAADGKREAAEGSLLLEYAMKDQYSGSKGTRVPKSVFTRAKNRYFALRHFRVKPPPRSGETVP